ncbi:hypothetical protein EB077_10835, partial [bacterium]|nr:hypothetical protein [bacterium]
ANVTRSSLPDVNHTDADLTSPSLTARDPTPRSLDAKVRLVASHARRVNAVAVLPTVAEKFKVE